MERFLLIFLDPSLQRSGAERALDQDRDRDKVKAADARHLIRRDLAECPVSVREIPERALTPRRLVDTGDRVLAAPELDKKRGVGRLQQPAGDLQISAQQRRECWVGHMVRNDQNSGRR